MKKVIIGLCLILATATSVFALNYEEAKLQNKPIVIMFHMHGCGGCRKFSPIFDKFSSNFSDKFNFVKEDIHSSKLASQPSVSSLFDTVPAIFIMEPKTQKLTRISDDCAWDNECFTKTLKEYK